MLGETFWMLLRDPAHWEFELFLMLVFDVLIGAVLWGRFIKPHIHRDDELLRQAILEHLHADLDRESEMEDKAARLAAIPGQHALARERHVLSPEQQAAYFGWKPEWYTASVVDPKQDRGRSV